MTTTQAKFREAAGLHQKGRLPQAEAIYEEILRGTPDHAEALHLLGVVAFQTKRYQRAVDLIGQAIQVQSGNAAFHASHGLALRELGRLDEAVAAYDRAITFNRNFAEAHNNRGVALRDLKRFDEAIASYDRAIRIKPDFAEAYSNRGNALSDLRQFAAAVQSYDRAISAKPDHAKAHNNRGIALKELKRFDEAIASYDLAIAMAPKFAEAHNNRGVALRELKRPAEAIASYDRAIAINANFAEAYNNRGAALRDLDRLGEAFADYDRAIAIKPDYAEAHNNRGVALNGLMRVKEAMAGYDEAIRIQPDYDDAYLNKSMALLTAGEFREGWTLNQKRRSVRSLASSLHRDPLPQDLTGKRLLLLKDQGLGDEIFFLRFAPELKRRGAHLTYRAGNKIVSMIRRLDCLDAVIDEDAVAPPSDMRLSVGDLPYLLRMTALADIPASLRLPVLPDRLAAQQAVLAALGPPPYVGVTWRAGTDQNGCLYKSAPLAAIGAVLRQSGGTLVGLQRLPESGELAALADAAKAPVHDFTALNDRLEDMLALLVLLDQYVTVSNTNVHLRAAVGKSSRVLVPAPPEFRWMAAGRVSPWFPDCTIYRQQADQSWDDALAALTADLTSSFTAADRGKSH